MRGSSSKLPPPICPWLKDWLHPRGVFTNRVLCWLLSRGVKVCWRFVIENSGTDGINRTNRINVTVPSTWFCEETGKPGQKSSTYKFVRFAFLERWSWILKKGKSFSLSMSAWWLIGCCSVNRLRRDVLEQLETARLFKKFSVQKDSRAKYTRQNCQNPCKC